MRKGALFALLAGFILPADAIGQESRVPLGEHVVSIVTKLENGVVAVQARSEGAGWCAAGESLGWMLQGDPDLHLYRLRQTAGEAIESAIPGYPVGAGQTLVIFSTHLETNHIEDSLPNPSARKLSDVVMECERQKDV